MKTERKKKKRLRKRAVRRAQVNLNETKRKMKITTPPYPLLEGKKKVKRKSCSSMSISMSSLSDSDGIDSSQLRRNPLGSEGPNKPVPDPRHYSRSVMLPCALRAQESRLESPSCAHLGTRCREWVKVRRDPSTCLRCRQTLIHCSWLVTPSLKKNSRHYLHPPPQRRREKPLPRKLNHRSASPWIPWYV